MTYRRPRHNYKSQGLKQDHLLEFNTRIDGISFDDKIVLGKRWTLGLGVPQTITKQRSLKQVVLRVTNLEIKAGIIIFNWVLMFILAFPFSKINK